MKVSIKDISVDMNIKNKGLELQVKKNDETLLGDCYVTKSGLVWCRGQTTRENGKKVPWNKFIKWAEDQ